MSRPSRRVGPVVGLVAVLAAGCESGTADRVGSGGTPSSPPSATPSTLPSLGPRLNWDDPAGRTGKPTTLARAKVDGLLPFEVPTPRIGRAPALVQVADPTKVSANGRALYVLYRMPIGPEFPEGGRLVLKVSRTDATVRTLRDMDRLNAPPDGYQMVTIAGREALLIQDDAKKVGHVVYVDGGFMYSVTGPAVSPAAARKYAELLLF